MSTAEIGWAAGLFEAKGSITTSRGVPRVQLTGADEEIVRRFARVAGAGAVYGPYGSSRVFMWIADGDDGRVILQALLPWLGERRRDAAQRVFALVTGDHRVSLV